jgi:hypothetical protein
MHPLAKLPCPVCQEATDSLKSYRLILFRLFIGIGASHKSATVVSCPSCMRKRLLKLALVNLIPGNVLWVICWTLVFDCGVDEFDAGAFERCGEGGGGATLLLSPCEQFVQDTSELI